MIFLESRKTVVLPLLRKCTEQSLILRDASLSVVAKQLGPWAYALKEILSPQETRWFLETYMRIVNLPSPDSDKSLQILSLTCRRQCAYNFPVSIHFGKNLHILLINFFFSVLQCCIVVIYLMIGCYQY